MGQDKKYKNEFDCFRLMLCTAGLTIVIAMGAALGAALFVNKEEILKLIEVKEPATPRTTAERANLTIDYDTCTNLDDLKKSVIWCDVPLYSCTTDGACLPSRLRCNGISDCTKNTTDIGPAEDELDCEESCNAFVGAGESFNCTVPNAPNNTVTNSSCFPISQKCNGVMDCEDGSDEENCADSLIIHTSGEKYTCASGMSFCDDKCLPNKYWCDGFTDCTNGQDEMSCEDEAVDCKSK